MPRPSMLRRSEHTERALARPRPRLRGRFHLLAAVLALPLAVAATSAVPSGRERLAVGAFGLSMVVMFTFSALLHLRRWAPDTHEILLRLDHCGIYTAIAGTAVAVAALGLRGWAAVVLLGVAIGGLVVGVLVEWLPFAPPRGLNNAIYLTLGWTPVLLVPAMWVTAGPLAVGLLFLGGLLYTLGAIVVGLQRPDPWPGWFGYHELFHLLVIAAVAVHAGMVGVLTVRA